MLWDCTLLARFNYRTSHLFQSIVAIGAAYLNFYQPALPALPPRKFSERRRSAPASLETHKLAPTVTRRVYFADSAHCKNSLPQPVAVDSSPRSSSSTLVSASSPPHLPINTLDTCEESAAESDNSSRKSAQVPFKLPKLISRVHRRTLSTAERSTTRKSLMSKTFSCLKPNPGPDGPASSALKRSNTSLSSHPKHLPVSRTHTSTDTSFRDSLPTSPRITFRFPGSRVVSTPVSSPTSPSRFKSRCPSISNNKAPVPRTHPYEYPYFATPPILSTRIDSASDPERTRRPDDARTDNARARERRQLNAQAQASLGLGCPLHRQRSASDSWLTNRPVVHAD